MHIATSQAGVLQTDKGRPRPTAHTMLELFTARIKFLPLVCPKNTVAVLPQFAKYLEVAVPRHGEMEAGAR